MLSVGSAAAEETNVYDWIVKFNGVFFGITGAQVVEIDDSAETTEDTEVDGEDIEPLNACQELMSNVELSLASIAATQLGTYELQLAASKEGYQEASVKEQFAVIEKEIKPEVKTTCNADGVCDSGIGENQQTCPQDCPRLVVEDSVGEILESAKKTGKQESEEQAPSPAIKQDSQEQAIETEDAESSNLFILIGAIAVLATGILLFMKFSKKFS
ncbi:hypothetical protein CMO88_01500 [Candidatus Woesearchaeota archaeon]|nr:hypothetical protein [Candidatus Woesearchaeota archaeon]